MSNNAATIYDSYKIKKWSHMKEVIEVIKSLNNNPLQNQSTFILICEWRVHNLLYWLKIQKDRTKDCDLNINKWYLKIAYTLLSILYVGQ
jgi:hypothetical protein